MPSSKIIIQTICFFFFWCYRLPQLRGVWAIQQAGVLQVPLVWSHIADHRCASPRAACKPVYHMWPSRQRSVPALLWSNGLLCVLEGNIQGQCAGIGRRQWRLTSHSQWTKHGMIVISLENYITSGLLLLLLFTIQRGEHQQNTQHKIMKDKNVQKKERVWFIYLFIYLSITNDVFI